MMAPYTALFAVLLAGPVPTHPTGYLLSAEGTCVPYQPRAGDLVFFDDRNAGWRVLFAIAGTGAPLHMGIVVKRADGKLMVLEAGPDDTIWVTLQPLGERLRQFERDFSGKVSIRSSRKPLTREQSLALTRFALMQEGKRYAILRLLAQGTPFRARGPWPVVAARTYLDRDAWICSELAVAGAAVAGLIRADAVPANATYPRDLIDNKRHDLSAVWLPATEWRPGTAK